LGKDNSLIFLFLGQHGNKVSKLSTNSFALTVLKENLKRFMRAPYNKFLTPINSFSCVNSFETFFSMKKNELSNDSIVFIEGCMDAELPRQK
jgi:hypothetical protein